MLHLSSEFSCTLGELKGSQNEDTRDGSVGYGFRAYDDFAQTYGNQWESIPDDDLEFLAKAMESDDKILSSLLSWLQEMEKGLYIGTQYYDWCEIKHLFKESSDEC